MKYWFAFKVFRKYKHTVTKDSSGLLYWKGAGCGGKVPKLRINIFKLCVLKDRIFSPIKTCRAGLLQGNLLLCTYSTWFLKKLFSYNLLKWFLPMPPTGFMNFQVAERFPEGIPSTINYFFSSMGTVLSFSHIIVSFKDAKMLQSRPWLASCKIFLELTTES